MAEIEIKKQHGMAWLGWLIAIAIVLVLVWWFVGSSRSRASRVATDTTAMPATPATGTMGAAPASAAPITNMAMLTGSPIASGLVNRTVMLTDVPVASVVSDKGFWAGSATAADQRVFVVRGNQNSPATAPNGAVDSGRVVTIYGTVQQMPADLTQQTTDWNLKSTDAQALASQSIYIQADTVRITTP